MREILFKAKRLNDGEWVEGNIVYVAEDADFMPGAYILPRLVSASAAPPTKGIMLGDFFEVDPSTVCEYTGLIDKNGKKIFEGDIIRWTNWKGEQKEAPVCYDQEWNRFCVWLNGAESMGVNKHLSTSGIEIIGSIHDGEGGQREEG